MLRPCAFGASQGRNCAEERGAQILRGQLPRDMTTAPIERSPPERVDAGRAVPLVHSFSLSLRLTKVKMSVQKVRTRFERGSWSATGSE